MVSHIANAYVLHQAGEQPLSQTPFARPLRFFGRLASLSDNSMLRNTVLQLSSSIPKQFLETRRRGRPRLSWSCVLYVHAFNASRMKAIIFARHSLWRQLLDDGLESSHRRIQSKLSLCLVFVLVPVASSLAARFLLFALCFCCCVFVS
ncbi:unnamed protein product [Polarella glacialis]|uniref:Uncharacterized protein n=1 Tax=Polarella glacialis TaxID=89957 RepID=A0A813FEN3_POLGL|nr:unnamed protein product [Polarella glacialis]